MENVILKNGKELIIKTPTLDDAEKIIGYMHIIGDESDFLTFNLEEMDLTVDDERKFIESSSNKKSSVIAVGLIDGEIAGLINLRGGLRSRVIHCGEMGLSVQKAYWHIGVGSALISWLIQWAKNTGVVRKINLIVRTDNGKAIALYNKYGFIEEGRLSRDFLIDGKFYDSYTMGLKID